MKFDFTPKRFYATTPPDPNQLKQVNKELSIIEDSLTSIGVLLQSKIEEAFSNIEDSTKSIAQVYASNLEKSIKGMAKNSDAVLKNTMSILSGESKSKDIKKQIEKLDIQRLAVSRNLDMLERNGLTNSIEKKRLSDDLTENYELQKKLLQDQLELSKEQEKKISKKKSLEDLYKAAQDKFNIEQIKDTFTLAGLFKLLIDSAFRFSKISTDIGKNLGYGADKANEMANRMAIMAQGSSNMNFTLQNAADAMNELSTATGYVAEYSADTLEIQIMLTKQFGLQADEAAGIYKLSVLTGKSSEAVNDAMVSTYVAMRNQLGVGVPFKATIAEASKVSGQLAANLKSNPEQIVKAVVQAKALGTSLEQVKNQGESLLDFETSISNQLKAELITGQQLNLEKARAAALAGDQVMLAQELSKQGMTLEKFQSMNVIAQKTFATALGLSADQLADQLQKQKLAVESGKSLAQITEEEAKQAQERQNAQDKFNASVTKLQDLIGNVVAGPLGKMLDIISDIGNVLSFIISKIQELLGNTAVKTLIGALTGLAVGGPWGALIGGAAGALSGVFGDDVVGYGARTLITPQGAVALNNNDTVIAGTNLFKGDDVTSFPKGALSLGDPSVVNTLKEIKSALISGNNKQFGINLDGRAVGTGIVRATYQSA
jgi:hypothetical protein